MPEHVPVLKNNQNPHHRRFGFIPKKGTALSKMGDLFSL